MTPEVEFVARAHPHSWLLVADSLHSQALALSEGRGPSITSEYSPSRDLVGRWDAANRSMFLLGGFALENCIKAFLVYENPTWISNGRLSRLLKSHKLTALAAKSRLLPYQKRGVSTLRAFEAGLETWARYPCGLSIEESQREQVLDEKLWLAYVKLMRAYVRRLQTLLSKMWHGPHGTSSHFEFSGDFFGVLQTSVPRRAFRA